MKKDETKGEMEERDAAGYERLPSDAREFEEWEKRTGMARDEKREPAEAIAQTAVTAGGMDEALERAAEIRDKLESRHHSDSTEIVSKDRQR